MAIHAEMTPEEVVLEVKRVAKDLQEDDYFPESRGELEFDLEDLQGWVISIAENS